MSSPRAVLSHPGTVLGAFALAFAGWLGWDLCGRQPQPAVAPEDSGVADLGRRPLPRPLPTTEAAKAHTPPTTEALAQLKPGMTRAEVEGVVGTPAAHDIHPAIVEGMRVTYQIAYEVEQNPPLGDMQTRKQQIKLEYDATQPGHPLVGVRLAP